MQKPSVNKKSSAKKSTPRVRIDNPLLKIGDASKILGVSIDTLRRWEKAGKIETSRTPGGTRLYHLSALEKIKPAAPVYPIGTYQTGSLSTEEILKKVEKDKVLRYDDISKTEDFIPDIPISQYPNIPSFRSSFLTKFLIGSALLSTITLLVTASIIVSYLVQPKTTQDFFKNNAASLLLHPFYELAEVTVTAVSPVKAKEWGFMAQEENPPPLTNIPGLNSDKPGMNGISASNVLAVTASSPFLEVNSDTQINGSLFVRDNINGLTLEATPSAGTMEFIAGSTSLTVTKTAKLDQDVSTAASPTFNILNLSAAKDQLVFQSGGPTGTLTWTPATARVITLPDTTGTVVLDSASQAITNKTINASSNTITNIPNSALANSKITVTAGTNLTGGGDISLGSSATLSLKDSVSLTGTLGVTGATTLSSTLAVSGITTLTGATTISSNLSVSGNVGIGYTGSAVTAPALGLAVSGNVGIGTTSPAYKLDVIGQVNGSAGLCIAGDCKSSWTAVGGYTASNGITLSSTDIQLGGSLSRATGIDISGQNFGFLGGNVGIGNSNPDYALKVTGTGYFSSFVGIGSSLNVSGNVGIGQSLTVTSGTSLSTLNTTGLANLNSLNVTGISQLTGNVGVGSSLTVTGLGVLNGGLNVSGLANLTGNVGVGGSAAITSNFRLSGQNCSILTGGGKLTTDSSGNVFCSADSGSGITSGTGAAGAVTFWDTANTLSNSVANFYWDSANFRLGVGTSNPQYRLDVGGTGYFSGFVGIGSSLSVSGNVGIGQSLAVTSAAALSTLNTTGLANLASLNVTGVSQLSGNVGVGNSLTVTGLALANGGLNVTGYSNLTGNVGIGTSLTVTSLATFNAGLTTTGLVTSSFRLSTSPSSGYALVSDAGGNGAWTDISSLSGSGGNIGAWTLNGSSLYPDSLEYNIGIGTSSTSGARLSVMAGNVGIGTTTANSNLSVSGNTHIGSLYQSISAPANGLFVDGNVGIGATTSNNKLDVWGNSRITGTLTVDSTATLGNALIGYSGVTVPALGLAVSGNLGIGTTSPLAPLHIWGNGTNSAFFLNGNLGIGTTIPNSLLSLNAPAGFSVNIFSAGLNGTTFLSLSNAGLFKVFDSTGAQSLNLSHDGTNANITVSTGKIVLGSGGGTLYLNTDIQNTGSNYLGNIQVTDNFTVTGNVGIGTTSPNAKLSIQGNVGIGFTGPNQVIPSNGLAVSGNVGIGTTTANSTLSVSGSAHIGGLFQGIVAPVNGLFVDGNVGIGATTSSNKLDVWGNSRLAGTLTVDSTATLGNALIGYSGVTAPALGLAVSGNVGIGTTSPAYKLDVIGQVNGSAGLCIAGDCKSSWTAVGGYTASNGITLSSTDIQLGGSLSRATGIDISGQNFGFLGGNVGIGNSNPDYALKVTGTGYFSSFVGIGSSLNVSGNVGIGNSLTVTSGANLSSSLNVTGNTNLTTVNATGLAITNTSNTVAALSLTNNTATTIGNGGNTLGVLDLQSTSLTTGNFLNIELNGLSSGKGLNLTSTSTALSSGNLLNLDWSPTTATTATGDLLNIGIGVSGNIGNLLNIQDSGSSIFSISESYFTTSLPASFTAAGDVSIAYDLNFTNPTASYIKSAAPLYIVAGEVFNSSDLNLTTYNQGQIFLNSAAGVYAIGNVGIGVSYNAATLPSNGLAVQGNVGIGTSTANSTLSVAGSAHIGSTRQGIAAPTDGLFVDGNVGIGATTSNNKLDVWGNSRLAGTLTVDSTATVGVLNATSAIQLGGANINTAGTLSNVAYLNQANVFTQNQNFNAGFDVDDAFVVADGGALTTSQSVTLSGNNNALTFTGSTPSISSNTSLSLFPQSGNVGIGISGPLSGVLTVKGLGNTTGITFQTYGAGTNLTQGLTVLDNGNVGIGTTSPSQLFQVNSSSSNPVVITSGGNMGIGFTTPDRKLQIGADITGLGNALGTILGAGGSQLDLTGSTANTLGKKLALGIDTSNNVGFIQTGASLGVGTTSAYTLSLNPLGGNVGIGTTSPGSKLDISGDASVSPTASALRFSETSGQGTSRNWLIGNGSGPSYGDLAFLVSAATGGNPASGGTQVMTITGGGNVGIGATTSSNKMDVWGNSRLAGTLTVDSTSTFGSSLTLSSGQFLAPIGAGTAGNVSYSFTGDTDTGMFSSGANNLSFAVNGEERFRVTSNADIAIAAGAKIFLDGVGGNGDTYIQESPGNTINFYAGGTRAMNIASGNVGIGFTSPERLLQLASDINIVGSNASLLGAAGTQFAITGSSGTGGTEKKLVLGIDTTDNYGVIQAGAVGTNYALSLNPAGGNVGIGTTSPTSTLQVLSGSTAFTVSSTGNVGIGTSVSVTSAGVFSSGIKVSGSSDLSAISGTTLNTTGNVGLGASGSVTSYLSVGSLYSAGAVCLGTDCRTSWPVGGGESTTASNGLTLDGADVQLGGRLTRATGIEIAGQNFGLMGGNVGIGTSVSDYNLKVLGTGYFSSFLGVGSSMNVSGNVGVGQSLTVTSGTSLSTLNTTGLANLASLNVNGTTSITDTSNTLASLSLSNNTATTIGNGGNTLGVIDLGSTSLTTGNFMNIELNGLSTGKGINLTSTSTALTTGNLMSIDWSPGSATTATSGDLFKITIGTNGTLSSGNLFNIVDTTSSIFSVSESYFTTSLPASFNAAGDVSIAYDLNFTNPTASYIKSNAPLYITAGKVFNSSDLTLTTYNQGQIFLNSAAGVYAIGNVGIGVSYNAATLPSNGLAVQGNVGIGTSTANSTLSVAGSAHIGSTRQGIAAPTDGLLVDGNVGIGATTSNNKLDVWGNSRLAGTLTVDSTSTFGGNLTLTGNLLPSLDDTYDLGSNTARWNNVYVGPSTLHLGTSTSDEYTLAYDTTNNRLGFNVNGSGLAEIVMDSSGNVGLGTTGPGALLDIAESTANLRIYASSETVDPTILFSDTDNLAGEGLKIWYDNSEGDGYFDNIWNNVNGDIFFRTRTAGTAINALSIRGDGNVGIGATTSSSTLDVWGTSRFTGDLTNDPLSGVGNRALYSTAVGVLTNSASDIRLKTDIQTISNNTDVLSALGQLRGVYFNWDQNNPDAAIYGTRRELGMIAQEVETVLPELIGTNANGYKSLNYAQFTGFLVEVAKAQQQEINSLLTQQATSSALLAGLSISPDGTLNVPKLQADKITLSADINLTAPALASLLANTSGVGFDSQDVLQGSNEVSIDVLASLGSISEAILGLSTQEATTSAQLASLESKVDSQESRVKNLEEKLASLSAQLAQNTATSSSVIASEAAAISTSSNEIATSSSTPRDDVTTLNLTPPSILLATGSATLTTGASAQLIDLTVTSDATISGMLTAYQAEIQDNFKVFGQTTLGSTLVAGDLTVDGTLTLTGNSLSTLNTLYIQNSSLAGPVDFFNGLVTIDKAGKLTAQVVEAPELVTQKLTISNQPLGPSPPQGPSIGSDKILAGNTKVAVLSNRVLQSSKIFITPRSSTGKETPFVELVEPGVGFVVSIDQAISRDIDFDWWIVETR